MTGVAPHLYLEHATALQVDLLDLVRREPNSQWKRIEKRLSTSESEAVCGVAYELAQRFVDDGLLTVDGEVDRLYAITDAGVERLLELVPSGELPIAGPLEQAA